MALIEAVPPEQAEGKMKEVYDMFLERLGVIPRPLQMMSASPVIFDQQVQRIMYYNEHPSLGFALLSHIRYLVAHNLNYHFCTDFNKQLLKKQGLGDDDIRIMEEDPARSLLEEKDTAMLVFVVNAIKEPDVDRTEEIQQLKAMGWEDKDLMDALSHGVNMVDHSIMMQVFQVDQSCLAG